jgi:D-alanine transfer protein
MLAPFVIAIIFSVLLNEFLDVKIDYMLKNKNLNQINNEYGSIYKDKGVVYNEYVTMNEYPVLQGSSELGAQVSQVPTNFFPVNGFDKLITNGRAYSQNLHQISILGSQANIDKERKVALILSLQWFMNDTGIDNNSYQANFAPVQFYNFLDNKDITEEHRVEYASRAIELLEGSNQFKQERLFARLYVSSSNKGKVGTMLFKPYFYARKFMLELKDKGLLYKRLMNLPEREDHVKYADVDWDSEYIKAEKEAESQVSNNNFYVFDTYYEHNLKPYIEAQKNSNAGVNLMNSKEFDDYKLYLDTCVDLGIKPYIILMPTNGWWYDYTGMTKKSRDEFYDVVQSMGEQRGFEVLNLKDEEYTPYFMCDVMHLGTKGWLKVDEELYKYFKE